MPCNIPQETIEKVIEFHGHSCPGLAIGIRAAELALSEFDNPGPYELVTVVETDMCGVDAIQFLTDCTYGKGNLIHRDYGKMAFSFFHRKSERGIRALLKKGVRGEMDEEFGELMRKDARDELTETDRARLTELRAKLQRMFLELELGDMFEVKELECPPPRPAAILQSLVCDECGESTMESRTRRFGGKTMCIPCFMKVEQKI